MFRNDDKRAISSTTIYAVGGTLLAGLSLVIAWKCFRRWQRKQIRKAYPRNVVILHQSKRDLRAPNVSPFAMKLETWLRMADIKYYNDFTNETSPRGHKTPWITFNGIDMDDTQFIIDYLIAYFGKDLSDHLNPLEVSVALAYMKLNEESLRWCELVHRFRYGKAKDIGLSSLAFKIASIGVLKDAAAQGYGKYVKEEVYNIGLKDIDALETFIGHKKYLMGQRPCNEDSSLFGLFSQIIAHDRGFLHEHLMTKCPNILRHFETIKREFWPDWNDCIREGTSLLNTV